MKKFNLNNFVKVKLSSKGAEIKNMLNSDINKFFENKGIKDVAKLKADYVEGDVYEGQLWELMNAFGSALSVGSESPFIDCEIYFNDKDLKEAEA